MSGISCVIVISLLLCLMPLPCKGKVSLPPGGKTLIFVTGQDARIEWSFNATEVITRTFSFIKSDGTTELLAIISGANGKPVLRKSNLTVDVQKPATLILKSVNMTYNGTYQFFLQGAPSHISNVVVFVAAAPLVTVNCSSSDQVNEGDTVRCECESTGGNPPATVTWYKNGLLYHDGNVLTISDVSSTDAGKYICVARQSSKLTTNKSVDVTVFYKPFNTTVTLDPNLAIVGKKVVVTCEADGLPEPTYQIFRNYSLVSSNKTYTITAVKQTDAVPFSCVAKNRLGSLASTRNKRLSVDGPTAEGRVKEEDDLNIGAIVGGVLAAIVLLTVVVLVLWFKFYRHKLRCSGNVSPSSDKTPGSNSSSVNAQVDKSKKGRPFVIYQRRTKSSS